MTFPLLTGFAAGLLCTAGLSLVLGATATPPDRPPSTDLPAPQDPKNMQDMQQMMEKARRYTQPGPHHEHLKRFLGTWKTETRIFMGGSGSAAEAGTAEFSWLMEGRWLKGSASGTMMKRATESFLLIGYDNFKMSYVVTTVSSMDTAMLRSEGDFTQDENTLLTYGTLDEYLTGEHDKMVKYIWRFLGKDEFVLEVHDLAIGETNTKVVEVRHRRS